MFCNLLYNIVCWQINLSPYIIQCILYRLLIVAQWWLLGTNNLLSHCVFIWSLTFWLIVARSKFISQNYRFLQPTLVRLTKMSSPCNEPKIGEVKYVTNIVLQMCYLIVCMFLGKIWNYVLLILEPTQYADWLSEKAPSINWTACDSIFSTSVQFDFNYLRYV